MVRASPHQAAPLSVQPAGAGLNCKAVVRALSMVVLAVFPAASAELPPLNPDPLPSPQEGNHHREENSHQFQGNLNSLQPDRARTHGLPVPTGKRLRYFVTASSEIACLATIGSGSP